MSQFTANQEQTFVLVLDCYPRLTVESVWHLLSTPSSHSNDANTAECNAKFLTQCKAQCEAQGPLGGTGRSVMASWF
ncbi:hypothetical protein IE53DRAFT_382957, partial [Violaceomyces palustris]